MVTTENTSCPAFERLTVLMTVFGGCKTSGEATGKETSSKKFYTLTSALQKIKKHY
jgi:hypothetical protein